MDARSTDVAVGVPTQRFVPLLLASTELVAAATLALDLLVVVGAVISRSMFSIPIEWADDLARGLMVASSFFGAAAAVARSEKMRIEFFVGRLPVNPRRIVGTIGGLLVILISGYVAWHALELGWLTTGQTTGSGLPLEWTFYPMGVAMVCMTIFATAQIAQFSLRDIILGLAIIGSVSVIYLAWSTYLPSSAPSSLALMVLGLFASLCGGLPIGFAIALGALLFIWIEGSVPGVIFAQQMARGIDNFVLLAVPFFILVGHLMEANGMSRRLIELLQRLIGRVRGGLDVIMVVAMVLFSGISGSKMADVAAVGSALIPAARRSGQSPGRAVALLAASAVMAETIPPCINLIILGFVANISIGGLFMAGIVPAGLMAFALIATSVLFGAKATLVIDAASVPRPQMWVGGLVSFGLILTIFVGFKSGFATATEISAFAVVYALVAGLVIFRELGAKGLLNSFVSSASRSGLLLFIVAAAQGLAFVLTLQQIPHAIADFMIGLSHAYGAWLFILVSILILIVMGSVLEGAAALIIFGPLLMPVAKSLGIVPLHFGIILVFAMGIGLFAPPLGLGLYGACLVGKVPIDQTIKPILRYLGLLFVILLLIASVPEISLFFPRVFGYE